ncbi:hypothetical protein PGB90_001932 [Kerria lacca]
MESRILYDVACKVCQDNSSGKHYGIFACDGCAGFFKRSIRRNRQYICKGKVEGNCIVDKTHRNQCRACRLRKCMKEGMNKDAVQHERGPRNSTLQRQMTLYFKDSAEGPSVSPVLDLTSRISSTSGTAEDSVDRSTHPQNSLILYPPQIFPHAPPLIPTLNNPQTICESAANLVFLNIKLARNVPAFVNLPVEDQLILLKESWHELFILGAAQYLPPIELNPLISSFVELNRNKTKNLMEEAMKFQEAITKFRQLQVDFHEYACMRATILFKTVFDKETDEELKLKEVTTIRTLHEGSQQILTQYVNAAYPLQPFRLAILFPIINSNVAAVIGLTSDYWLYSALIENLYYTISMFIFGMVMWPVWWALTKVTGVD